MIKRFIRKLKILIHVWKYGTYCQICGRDLDTEYKKYIKEKKGGNLRD